jgi:lipoprotein-releasing system permease protein
MKSFERYVALRYLRGAEGRSEGKRFLRFVTYVAIGGVAVGVAALLLALMIVRGFSREIQNKIVGFGTHVQIEHFLDAPLARADTIAETLLRMDHVVEVTPAVIDFALLRAGRAIDGVAVWGTPEGAQRFLAAHMLEGQFTFLPDLQGRAGMVLGSRLANDLGVNAGDAVTVFSMREFQAGASGARPRVRPFYVAGIYETGLADFDALYGFVELDEARGLLGFAPDQVSRFDVLLTDIDRSEAVAERVNTEFGAPIMARSVFRVYHNLFAWINLQQSIIPVVISVIVLVAAFNIIGTLLMVILEKTREIGVLASMGASGKSVRRLFLWLGFMVGVVGTAIGSMLALVLAVIQLRYGVIPLPQEAYYLDTAPVELNLLDFVIVAAVAVALCTLSSYLPARVASRIEPLRSIRFAG